MEKSRAYVLASLVIMTLNDCSVLHRHETAPQSNEIISKAMNDTLLISKPQFVVLSNGKWSLDIEIVDDMLFASLVNSHKPVLKIELEGDFYIVKGNYIFSSGLPSECDYFYSFDDDNKILFINERRLILKKMIE